MVSDILISLTSEESFPVIHISGEIDIHTCPKVKDQMTSVISEGHHHFILDLEKTSYIDSTGLGVIAHIAKSINEYNGKIYIVSNNAHLKKLFTVSGLERKNIQLFGQISDVLNSVRENIAS